MTCNCLANIPGGRVFQFEIAGKTIAKICTEKVPLFVDLLVVSSCDQKMKYS